MGKSYIEEIFGIPESILEKLNGFNMLRGNATKFSFRINQSNVYDKVFVFVESVTTRGDKYGVILFKDDVPVLQTKKALTLGALPHYLERVTQASFGAIKKSEKDKEE